MLWGSDVAGSDRKWPAGHVLDCNCQFALRHSDAHGAASEVLERVEYSDVLSGIYLPCGQPASSGQFRPYQVLVTPSIYNANPHNPN